MTPGFLLSICLWISINNGFLIKDMYQNKTNSVCYLNIGCFTNNPPYRTSGRPVPFPANPASIVTRFMLFTKGNAFSAQFLSNFDKHDLQASSLTPGKKLKVLIHDYNGKADDLYALRDVILQKEDSDVIIVDWRGGSGGAYTQAVANTRIVGAELALLINFLTAYGNLPSQMHLIGLGLGAHIAGYAGELVTGLARITGLDPSDPLFQGGDPKVRLDPTDASFVDVIHTDGANALALGMGALQPMGHVDFYPNGGKDQPGCDAGLMAKVSQSWNQIANINYFAGLAVEGCSHKRALDLLVESIKSPCKFQAYPCQNEEKFHKGQCLTCSGSGCSEMGLNADKSSGRGTLYFDTQPTNKFCTNLYRFDIAPNNNMNGMLTVGLMGLDGMTEPIRLMKGYEAHEGGKVFTSLVKTNQTLGNIQAMAIQYDMNPLNAFQGTGKLSLYGVNVFDPQTQTLKRFCTQYQELSNHAPAIFTPC